MATDLKQIGNRIKGLRESLELSTSKMSYKLEVDEKDKAQLHLRIRAVYRKAVVRMRFFAEIWCVIYHLWRVDF